MSELVQRQNQIVQYANQEVADDCAAIQRAAHCVQEGTEALTTMYLHGEFKASIAEAMVNKMQASKASADSPISEDEKRQAVIRKHSYLNKLGRLMEFGGEETIRRVAQVTARDGAGRWPRLFR